MDFINPGILVGLAAASIPPLLHFLNRSRTKDIPFSTLTFLKELQQQKIKRLKIKQLLLLLLRTLIILLLVLAFARPTLRGPLSNVLDSNAQSSSVVIVDNSFSMELTKSDQSMFNKARDKAKELVAAMPKGDELYLLTTSDTSNVMAGDQLTGTGIDEKIDEIKTVYTPANLYGAVHKAHDLLVKSSSVNKEIYILSDLQPFASQDTLNVETVRTFALPVRAANIHNVAVTRVRMVSTLLQVSQVAKVQVTLYNSGEQETPNILAELFVDGKVAQAVVQIPPKSSITQDFKFVLNKTGFISGYVKLEQDDLAADNKHFFSVYVPETYRTAIISGNPEDSELLSLALRPGSSASRFQVESLPEASLSSLEFNRYDVLILANLMVLNDNTADQLVEYVNNGGGLVLVLGANTNLQSFNRLLAKTNLPEIASLFGTTATERSTISLGYVDKGHPLFYGMFDDSDAGFTRPNFSYAVLLGRDRVYDRIMDYSTGDPFLLAKKLGSGRIAVMTSDINPRFSDISRRTIFAPLMNRLVQYTGSKYEAESLSVQVGQPLRIHLPVELVNHVFEMQRPDESFDRLEPVITTSGPWIEYEQTNGPGIYTLAGNNKTVMSWAVNVDPKESVLTQVADDTLKTRFGAEILGMDTDFKQFLLQSRYGLELWSWFALAALILLLIEMAMFRTRRGDETE